MLSRQRDLVMTSIRLDKGLHGALRQIAFNRRVSLHSLLIEGAKLVHAEHQQQDEGQRRDSNGTHGLTDSQSESLRRDIAL